MANEEVAKRKYYNRKSVRPEFAEDVYGGCKADSGNSGGSGRSSTVTVSGGEYNKLSTPNKNDLESSGMTWLDSSPFKNPPNWDKQSYAYSRQDSSKFESFGKSCSKDDFDHKNRQYIGEMDFQYADCDKFSVELAELYTYSEMEDFLHNFEEFCMYLLRSKYEKTECWMEWSSDSKLRLMQDVLQGLESADSIIRLDAARLVLYILQGTYGDYTDEEHSNEISKDETDDVYGKAENEEEQGFFRKISQRLKKADGFRDSDVLTPPDVEMGGGKDRGTGGNEEHCLLNAAANAYFVYESGLFQPLCAMLAFEREESSRKHLAKQQSVSSLNSSVGGGSLGSGQSLAGGGGSHRRSATLADNESLRVVMNCLYHMVESIRRVELVPQISNFCKNLSQQRPRAFFPYNTYTTQKLTQLRQNFISELDEPLDTLKMPLVIFLFDMMPDFVRGKSPHFPIKKMLLLTWKILLATLGGIEILREEKQKKRHAAGLPLVEDTLEVAMSLKPVIYGSENEADVFISKLSRIGLKNSKVVSMECGKMRFLNRQIACSSSTGSDDGAKMQAEEDDDGFKNEFSMNEFLINEDEALNDDAFHADDEGGENTTPVKKPTETPNTPKADGSKLDNEDMVFNYSVNKENTNSETLDRSDSPTSVLRIALDKKLEKATTKPPKGTPFARNLYSLTSSSSSANGGAGDQTPRAGSPEVPSAIAALLRLPWRTKVREKDLETFLQKERQKYFGYQLPNDSTTLYGLPYPVLQSVLAFRRNIYISLGDLQIKSDDEFNRFPFSRIENVEETNTERLYRRMVPNMTEYVITLLKVILASLPSSKTKSDAVTILSDVLTPETDTNEMLSNSISLDISGKNVLEEAVRFAIDINRHKELIVKASSAIIILLLKFFRLNHIYQFESFAQYLVLANCLPLVLKFIDQNILRYIQSKHELSPLNYPQCALHYVRNDGEWPVLNADNVYECDTEVSSYYLWRNVFSSINLLRVLNKLTKWKHARTMMLVVFKSAPILKRCMRVRLGIFQLYVLKLLKVQARFLGRQWRKSNMDIISSIYMKVRHRLNDDWAFANETRSKSWDFQAEESELGVAIKRFNRRRYKHSLAETSTEDTNNPPGKFSLKDPLPKPGACADALRITNANQKNEQSGTFSRVLLDTDEDADAATTDDGNGGELDNNVFGDGLANTSLTLEQMDPRDFEPYDNCLQSVLSWQPKFSERFTQNYAKWVDEEVIHGHINWDFLLASTRGIAFEQMY